jgi:hypothetical protein
MYVLLRDHVWFVYANQIVGIHQILLTADHNPKQYPDLVKLYPMLLTPLVRRMGKSRESHSDPNTEFQNRVAPSITDGGSFSHVNSTLDIPPLGAEPMDTTLLFEDGPMNSHWLQM